MTWSTGYVTELAYVGGYQPELNPQMLRLACLSAGIVCNIPDEPIYLELGFGQGFSINLHAAAGGGQFWGCDFNPAHTSQALNTAAQHSAAVTLSDDSFAEFAARQNLPEFDVIVLHGVWSWVSEEAQKSIIDIIRRKLKPGGIVYISYNCLPGWAPMVPIREMMLLKTGYTTSRAAGTLSMIEEAIEFVDELVNADSLFFRLNPAATRQLARMKSERKHYIAHEFLNQHWHVPRFADLAWSLDSAKLTYAGSARLIERIDALHLTQRGQAMLAGIGEPILRETVRDHLVNQRFRCDVFVKGHRTLSRQEQEAIWLDLCFVRSPLYDDVPKTVQGALGDAVLDETICAAIYIALSTDHTPVSVRQMAAALDGSGVTLHLLLETLMILAGMGYIHPTCTPDESAIGNALALNRYLCRRALTNTDINYLACPITGGGVIVPHIWQIFLHAIEQGITVPENIASFAGEALRLLNIELPRDKDDESDKADDTAILLRLVEKFVDCKLPMLSAYKVI